MDDYCTRTYSEQVDCLTRSRLRLGFVSDWLRVARVF